MIGEPYFSLQTRIAQEGKIGVLRKLSDKTTLKSLVSVAERVLREENQNNEHESDDVNNNVEEILKRLYLVFSSLVKLAVIVKVKQPAVNTH